MKSNAANKYEIDLKLLCNVSRRMLKQTVGRRRIKRGRVWIVIMALCGATAATSVQRKCVDVESEPGVIGS